MRHEEKGYVAFQCRDAQKSPNLCSWGTGYFWDVTTQIDCLPSFAAVLSLAVAYKLHSGCESSIETAVLK